MSLANGQKVYQSDLMHITPEADAAIYALSGDYILRGLDISASDETYTLSPGRALLQGRLFELTQEAQITVTGSGYIGVSADLTQTNVDNGDGTIVNNQYTLTSSDTIAGDLNDGDLQAFIPLYNVSSGTVTQLVWPHDMDATLSFSSGWKSHNPNIQLSKRGKIVTLVLGAARDGSSSNTTITNVPAWATPRTNIVMTCASNNQISGTTMATVDCEISTSGAVRIVHVPINENKYITGTASWSLA